MSGAMVTDPAARRFQAVTLRAHLRMHVKGMRHSRMSGTALLGATSRITGKAYKRGQYQPAVDDLTSLLATTPGGAGEPK